MQISQSTDSLIALSILDTPEFGQVEVFADAVEAFYVAKTRGVPWTYGTTDNLIVQTFEYPESDGLAGTVLTAEVPGVSVDMECEPIQIDANPHLIKFYGQAWAEPVLQSEFLLANISGAGCQIMGATLAQYPASNADSAFDDLKTKILGYESNFQGRFDYYLCNSGFNYEFRGNSYDAKQTNETSSADYCFLLTMSKMNWYIPYNTTSFEFLMDDPDSNWTIEQSTRVLCKPSYKADDYRAALVPSNKTLQAVEIVPNTSTNLTGFNMRDFVKDIVNATSAAAFGQGGEDYIVTPVPAMFELLAGLNNGSRQEAFIDLDLLRNLSTQALQGIGTQLIQKSFQADRIELLSGFVSTTQQRLLVKRLTVGLLTTTLGLLAIIVLFLLRIRPWDLVPCSTESLASAGITQTAHSS